MKKNLSEYIDYLIFEKRIFNSKKTIFIFIGIFLIALLTVLISINKNDDEMVKGVEYTNDEKISILEDYGYSNIEIENMSDDEINKISNKLFIDSRNQSVGDIWSNELDKVESSTLKNDYYQYASIGEYKSIIESFNQYKQKYMFSEAHNKKLVRIYNDAYSLNTAFSNAENKILLENALNNLNDENMLLYAILQSDIETKNKVFKDRMSLSFTDYDNDVRVFSTISGSMKYMYESNMHKSDSILLKLFDYLNDGDYIIYKINFSLNLDTFNAYLYKNCDTSKVNIFGVYAENTSQLKNSYNTVAEMDSMFSMIEYNANNGEPDYDYDYNYELSEGGYDESSSEISIENSDDNYNIEDDISIFETIDTMLPPSSEPYYENIGIEH